MNYDNLLKHLLKYHSRDLYSPGRYRSADSTTNALDDDTIDDAFRFGVELEMCISYTKNKKQKTNSLQGLKLEWTDHDDYSILCPDSAYPIEKVTTHPFRKSQFKELIDDIKIISENAVPCKGNDSNYGIGEGLGEYSSCSTHLHMSKDNYTVKNHPLFLVAIQLVWITQHQRYMIDRFYKYQYRHLNAWCTPNTELVDFCDWGTEDGRKIMLNVFPTWKHAKLKHIQVEFRGLGDILEHSPGHDTKIIEYMGALCKVWHDAANCEKMLLDMEPSFDIPRPWVSHLHTLNISCIMRDVTDADALEIVLNIVHAFQNGILGKLVRKLIIQLKGYEALHALGPIFANQTALTYVDISGSIMPSYVELNEEQKETHAKFWNTVKECKTLETFIARGEYPKFWLSPIILETLLCSATIRKLHLPNHDFGRRGMLPEIENWGQIIELDLAGNKLGKHSSFVESIVLFADSTCNLLQNGITTDLAMSLVKRAHPTTSFSGNKVEYLRLGAGDAVLLAHEFQNGRGKLKENTLVFPYLAFLHTWKLHQKDLPHPVPPEEIEQIDQEKIFHLDSIKELPNGYESVKSRTPSAYDDKFTHFTFHGNVYSNLYSVLDLGKIDLFQDDVESDHLVFTMNGLRAFKDVIINNNILHIRFQCILTSKFKYQKEIIDKYCYDMERKLDHRLHLHYSYMDEKHSFVNCSCGGYCE